MATEPNPEEPLLDAMTTFADTVAVLAGMRAQLVRDGWTDDEARKLVVAMWWQVAFGSTPATPADGEAE